MLAAWALLATFAAPLLPPCEHLTLQATVSRDLRSVSGTLTCQASSQPKVTLAAYPRLLRQPLGLDDVSARWTYPNGFDRGDMRLWQGGVELIADSDGDGAWQPLAVGAVGGSWEVRFVTRVPERNGTLGWSDGVATLLGGWHPAIGQGPRLADGPIDYQITVPEGVVGLVGRKPLGRSSPRVQAGRFSGKFVPMLLAPNATVHVRPEGVLVAPNAQRVAPRKQPELGLNELSSGLDPGTHQEILRTLSTAAVFARQHHLPTAPLVVVMAPLRNHLVEPFDGGLAVSNRAFHMLPWELILRFHRAAIWREQLGAYARQHARAVEVLPPELAADAVAACLRSQLWDERYDSLEYAPDLLEHVAIIPEIDALIFAPQVPFIDTYYNAVDETPRARVRLDDFYHDFPRGKLLYEKLKDQDGETTLRRIVDRYLQSDAPFLQVASQVTRRDSESFAQRWLGPYPRVNYGIGAIAPAADDPNALRVEILKNGPEAGWVREPVSLQVRDGEGVWHRTVRQGPGVVDVPLGSDARRAGTVQLDPDNRLVELWHPPGYGPRYDNRVPPRWRLLLNNISGLVAVTNQQISLAADFGLRRINNLGQEFEFYAAIGPGVVSAAVVSTFKFGGEITPLRLAESVAVSASFNHLRTERGISLPGDEITLSTQYSYDTRLNAYSSFTGQGVTALGTGGIGRSDNGELYGYGKLAFGALQLFQLSLNHALVLRLRADVMFGTPAPQDLLRLGARYVGARGFEQDELRGKTRVLASGEYRHVLTGQSRNDLWGVLLLTRLEGAVFADAAYLPAGRADCPGDMHYDVGYGLRAMMDMLNLSPSSLQIDVGFPLNRCAAEQVGRVPVTVYLGFVQSFSSF